jgi:hypothetical protein
MLFGSYASSVLEYGHQFRRITVPKAMRKYWDSAQCNWKMLMFYNVLRINLCKQFTLNDSINNWRMHDIPNKDDVSKGCYHGFFALKLTLKEVTIWFN